MAFFQGAKKQTNTIFHCYAFSQCKGYVEKMPSCVMLKTCVCVCVCVCVRGEFVCLLIRLLLLSVLTVEIEAWVIRNRTKTTSMSSAENLLQALRKRKFGNMRWASGWSKRKTTWLTGTRHALYTGCCLSHSDLRTKSVPPALMIHSASSARM